MAEIPGLGLSQCPPLCGLDEDMSAVLRYTFEDPDVPAERKDPAKDGNG